MKTFDIIYRNWAGSARLDIREAVSVIDAASKDSQQCRGSVDSPLRIMVDGRTFYMETHYATPREIVDGRLV